ncbi:hypothetical protein G6F43_011841 [Rhizopus delemar]|nr:hypothetical protein G6F43_011841 [Rhizopus delemar]
MSARKPNDLLSHYKVTKSTIRKEVDKSSKIKRILNLTKEQEDLMNACSNNDVSKVVHLLETYRPHLDPDRIRDSKLRTPLLIASASGNTELVKILIKYGADVNNPVGDIVGNTPLHLAVVSNNVDTVLTLLENGAKTSNEKKQLRAPLSLATSRLDLLMNQADSSRSLDQVLKVASNVSALLSHSELNS